MNVQCMFAHIMDYDEKKNEVSIHLRATDEIIIKTTLQRLLQYQGNERDNLNPVGNVDTYQAFRMMVDKFDFTRVPSFEGCNWWLCHLLLC